MHKWKVMTKLKSNKQLWVEVGNYKLLERAINKLWEQKKNRKTYITILVKVVVI